MDLRFLLALLLGKTILKILQLKGSGATAAPGLYSLKIDPNFVSKLSKKNNLESIVVSGTNGKTTTTRLISDILKTKYKLIHNRQGSNLLRGVASTLIQNSSMFGHINADLAVWEADEAALVEIVRQSNTKNLVLLNLFRDQLDRYGEINTTRKKWIDVIKNLPTTTKLILNSDDPSTNYLAKFSKSQIVYFGVEEDKISLPQIENVADVKYCINCNTKLIYKKLYSAHLGVYSCPKCTFKRAKPNISAIDISFGENFGVTYKVKTNQKNLSIKSTVPGLFNIYNTLAAFAVSLELSVPAPHIKSRIESYKPAFGRFEQLEVNGTRIKIFLVKNPAGTNEVIRLLATKNNLNLLLVLNDHIADGRDVSWIWDTNWEALREKTKSVYTAGTRAQDIALRLKYATYRFPKINIETNIKKALEDALEKNNELIILPTYSALLEIKQILSSKGASKWQNQ